MHINPLQFKLEKRKVRKNNKAQKLDPKTRRLSISKMQIALHFLPIVIATISVGLVSADLTDEIIGDNYKSDEAWSRYMAAFDKNVLFLMPETQMVSRENWESTVEIIIKHNQLARQGESAYFLGLNKYTDYDQKFLVEKRNRLNLPKDATISVSLNSINSNCLTSTTKKQTTTRRTTTKKPTSTRRTTTKKTTRTTTKKTSTTKRTTTKTSTTTTSTSTTLTQPTKTTPVYIKTGKPTLNYSQSFNWVDKGYVTPVKDQGLCGCCFAFSSIGSLEGQWFRKTGQLISLSEQQLVDCVYPGTGCEGGNMNDAYDYIAYVNGIQNETTYPYDSYYGDQFFSCRYDAQKAAANDTGRVQLSPGDEVALLKALKTYGPIATGIDGSLDTFLK